MNTSKLTIAALVLAGTMALPGCGVGEASNPDAAELREATPVPVEVGLPVRGDIFATYRATSTITSDADAPVLARVGGEVIELLAEEGDTVVEGQVLARLDGDRARLEMLAARADLDQLRKELERYTDLAERGLVSVSMFEGLKYDVDALQASYELKKLNYEYSRIRAPISGVVSSRDVKLGQSVAADTPVFRITDNSKLVAYLQIPQAELSKFAAGHTATVQVDSAPGAEFAATIARISPTIDTRNGTFRATALIDNTMGALVPGMFARFTIAYEKHENALLVPESALIVEDEEVAVYVMNGGGEVTRRIIETGVVADNRIQVLAGLEDDDEIVLVGHGGLRDGSKVLASNRLEESFTG
jgi:membrane fusion protein (multidrug efflux system)